MIEHWCESVSCARPCACVCARGRVCSHSSHFRGVTEEPISSRLNRYSPIMIVNQRDKLHQPIGRLAELWGSRAAFKFCWKYHNHSKKRCNQYVQQVLLPEKCCVTTTVMCLVHTQTGLCCCNMFELLPSWGNLLTDDMSPILTIVLCSSAAGHQVISLNLSPSPPSRPLRFADQKQLFISDPHTKKRAFYFLVVNCKVAYPFQWPDNSHRDYCFHFLLSMCKFANFALITKISSDFMYCLIDCFCTFYLILHCHQGVIEIV